MNDAKISLIENNLYLKKINFFYSVLNSSSNSHDSKNAFDDTS